MELKLSGWMRGYVQMSRGALHTGLYLYGHIPAIETQETLDL